MKKKMIALLLFLFVATISHSAAAADREFETVVRENGDTYHQCINPGSNCAT